MKSILITSSILILLLAALRPLLRGRIDPRAQYALWLIAALRLLVPVELAASSYSALALLDRAEESTHLVQSIGRTSVPMPGQTYDSAYLQAVQEYQRNGNDTTCLSPDELGKLNTRAQELLARGPTLSELFHRYARPVWLGGAALMGLWFLLVNLQLRRKLRRALPVETDCPLPVYVSLELPSPCLCGLFRPAIYITPAALTDPDRLRHVLAHELTHYRHRDHWWAWARCLCLCLYWFDPLVWWAAALSRQDCELACDEGAIRRLGEKERLPYGRTLVAMIAAGRNPLLQTATTMTGGKRRVRERVELIARRPKTIIALALGLALILALAVGCTFTGAPEESPSPSPDPAPLSSDGLNTANLSSRLLDVPDELYADVDALSDTDPSVLAEYWMHRSWTDRTNGWGWLLSVRRWSRNEIDRRQGFPDSNDTDSISIFARDDRFYYTILFPTAARYFSSDDAENYHNAYDAIRTYAMQTVLETKGVEPFTPDSAQPSDSPAPAQEAVQAAMDNLIASPSVELTLAPAFWSRVYAYVIPGVNEWDEYKDYGAAYTLSRFAGSFQWAYLGGTMEDLPEPPFGDTLKLWTPDGSFIQVWSNSNVMLIQRTSGGAAETAYYEARDPGGDAPLGTFLLNPGPYQLLRQWFDAVELSTYQVTAVPDRGQSHEEVVEEWIEGFHPYTKCAPGNQFACTYLRPDGIRADFHSFMTEEEMEGFAQDRGNGHSAEDYGKTWFSFTYSLVFVPENENAKQALEAGNTADYTGDDAPEGAQICMRVGYMRLEDGQWVCRGVGTGW